MNINKKKLIVIVGPTASGKTELSIKIAQIYDSEIISADSKQFYKELNIGTAKPSENELKKVKHHFINNISINDSLSAGKYAFQVNELLKKYFKIKNTAVLVGGSGLFIDSILFGIDDIPSVPDRVRKKFNNLYKKKGLKFLCKELEKIDPEYYKIVDKNNYRRLIRALEVSFFKNRPYSSFLNNNKKLRKDLDIKVIGIDLDRNILNKKIDDRVDYMIKNGLLNEVKSLYKHKSLNSLNTIGYNELFKYYDKKLSLDDSISLIKSNTRKYSKRQMTWFRKYKNINWISQTEKIDEIKKIISS